MSIFALYMLFFGLSTIVGVPLLSLFQVTQIKGDSVIGWTSTLGATLGPASGIFVVVSLIAYFVLKPLQKTILKAQTCTLSKQEQQNAVRVLQKLNIISTVALVVGYLLGNGTTIIIKVSMGKLHYNGVEIFVIMVLIILYALIAKQYSVDLFNAIARKELTKLGIYDLEGIKAKSFPFSFFMTVLTTLVMVGWHLLMAGYGASIHHRTPSSTLANCIFALVLSLSLTLPMLFFLLAQLSVRFRLTISDIKDLRENGDLTSRINIGTFDDFGKVMTEVNALMEHLRISFVQLTKESQSVDSGAKELKTVVDQSTLGINTLLENFSALNSESIHQSDLLIQAKQNIDKLAQAAEEITQSVASQQSVSSVNREVIDEMRLSLEAMKELIFRSKKIALELSEVSKTGGEEVNKTMDIVTQVQEKSKRMNEVIKVIQSVSSQTNLLAMNAAIEAAHAGQAGAGFAVVADEIRKLAESSSKSAKDINELINEIINAVDESTASMASTKNIFNKIENDIINQETVVEQIADAMETQSENVDRTIDSSNEIGQYITNVNQLVQYQEKNSNELKDNISEVVSMSQRFASSMQESQLLIQNFASSVKVVEDKSNENKDSVLKITSELDKFKF